MPSLKLIKQLIKRFDRVFLNATVSRILATYSSVSSVAMDVSSACNLNCTTCSLKEWFPNSPNKLIPDDIVAKVVSFAPQLKHVSLQCNCEPLLNPNVHEIVASLKRANPAVTIAMVTNGMLLTKERSEQLTRSGIDEVFISLDGASKESYEAVRRGGVFKQVIENINTFNQVRDVSCRQKAALGIVTVVTKTNLNELRDILLLAVRMKADRLVVNGLEAYSDTMFRETVYGSRVNREAEDVLDTIRSLAVEEGIAVDLPSLVVRRRTFCLSSSLVIDADGKVFPCAQLSYARPFISGGIQYMHPRVCIGDLKHQTLDDIAASQRYLSFRNSIMRGSLPEYCRHCLVKDFVICGGA